MVAWSVVSWPGIVKYQGSIPHGGEVWGACRPSYVCAVNGKQNGFLSLSFRWFIIHHAIIESLKVTFVYVSACFKLAHIVTCSEAGTYFCFA